MPNQKRKVILSGIQPSGAVTIGNYIGALRHWVRMQEEYECFFMLVDMHAITVRRNPEEFRAWCYDTLSVCMACGVDPDRSTLFVQSHVPAHAELYWILNCYTQIGELQRMTQFKDKSQQHGVTAGLFNYPVLMAADILLYQADLVPIGDDQKQHLELCRNLAQRLNRIYGAIFTEPEPYIPPVGARVMSLQDPFSKMSKSDDNPKGFVALLDDPEQIRRKFKKAVTDSGAEIVFDESRPAISNLMAIYSAMSGDTLSDIEKQFRGRGYGDFKRALAEVVVRVLAPIQERYRAIREDEPRLARLLAGGAQAASRRAAGTLRKVKSRVGFIPSAG